jgi:hypothetical protein
MHKTIENHHVIQSTLFSTIIEIVKEIRKLVLYRVQLLFLLFKPVKERMMLPVNFNSRDQQFRLVLIAGQ